MDATLEELAALLGGDLSDPSSGGVRVTAVRSLGAAGPSDLAFFRGEPRYLDGARATSAAAILCDQRFEGAKRPLIVVEDAGLATSFLLAAERDLQNPPPPPGIHPTAIIDPLAELGADVTVGPYAVIEAGASVGDRSRILAHAFVGRDAVLGVECVLHPHAVVLHNCIVGARAVLWSHSVIGRDGFGFLQRDGQHQRIPQVGGVLVGDDVELGAFSSIDRGAVDPTVVESGVKIDSHCHVAHNCWIGEHAILVGYARMGGSVKIGRHAILAEDAAVAERRKVGDNAIVGSASTVQYEDVPDGEIVLGLPARPALRQKRIDVLTDRLPDMHAELRAMRKRLALLEERIHVEPTLREVS